jgi:predicted nucleotidyltransferase
MIEKQVLAHIKKEPQALGAFIFGSYARNPKGQHNDIDVLVLVDTDWKKRESIKIGKFVVELFYNSIEDVSNAVNKENDFNFARWFEDVKVLFDSDNRVKDLIKLVQDSSKSKLSVFNKDWFAYKVGDQLQDIKKEVDVSQKVFLMDCLVKDLINVFFLSKKILPPKDNYAIKYLHIVDNKFSVLVNDYLSPNRISVKYFILKEMVKFLEPVIGKPITNWTTKKRT